MVLIEWMVGLLTLDEYNAVVREFPRLNLMKELKETMCLFYRPKPADAVWIMPW
jgi:hypothetical protein